MSIGESKVYHVDNDPKNLTLFDVWVYKQGFIIPKNFRKIFEGKVSTPKYLGLHNWTHGLLEKIKADQLDGITFEGVVGKNVINKKTIMAKAKTQRWLDAIKAKYKDQANEIINS